MLHSILPKTAVHFMQNPDTVDACHCSRDGEVLGHNTSYGDCKEARNQGLLEHRYSVPHPDVPHGDEQEAIHTFLHYTDNTQCPPREKTEKTPSWTVC
ncbi:hypothetical protein GDO81_018703 [Engystomops pustulosus]|uniref:Uncharacterized protein n=1 Tax=Engystomops pustulosus TaxID=76066 RepID=A0AAV6ZDX9_ENGPU|nr:hypothetical protein GDO81_018703 [Engystomops pustulosus]